MTLTEEREAFNRAMRARAILMAVEWAGSAGKLAEMIGYTRHAGGAWVKRLRIPVLAALALERVPGFPLSAADLLPEKDPSTLVKRKLCPHCWREIRPAGHRPGCLPSFNGVTKAHARKQAASRRKDAKRNAQSAKRKAKTVP